MGSSTLKKALLICLAFLLLGSTRLYAQPDTRDKNTRHDPMVMKPGYKAPLNAEATVISISDYDNFKLGVDFAECSVTVNPRNPLEMYAVWNSTAAAGGRGYRTTNGFDWTAANPSWTGMRGDVVVVSDSTGKLYYQNMYGSTILGAKVAASANFGSTWDPIVNAIAGNDKNWIAADQTGGMYSNYIYNVMTAPDSGNHARSIDFGASYINTQKFSTQKLPGMMVAIGPKGPKQGGAVYIVTNSGSSYASTFTFYESNDGGLTFNQKSAQNFANYVGTKVGDRNSVQNMRTRPYPFIAADNSYGPHRGRLYLVYTSNFPAGDGNKPDIFCRYSDDGGATWSTEKTVNDDVDTKNNNNWFPAVWSDTKTGRLYISWIDTRDCPTSDSAMIYATYTDNGEIFAKNQQISNKKMKINCTSCGGGGTPMYLGDYNGIGSNERTSIIAWTDFRDRNFGSYVAYFPDYALRVEPTIDTLITASTITVTIPSVKLYTDTVFVSATVKNSADMFNIIFPQGNKISSFPGQIPIKITNKSAPNGNYTLEITTTGSNGTPVHKRSVTLKVFLPPIAALLANDSSICHGQSITFTDKSTGPPSTWLWSFPGGNPASSTDKNPKQVVYDSAGVFDVSLTVSSFIGTNTLVMKKLIAVHPSPAQPVAANVPVCLGLPVPDLTAKGSNIKWYTGNTILANGTNLTTGQLVPGTYTYTVTQTEFECESKPTTVSLIIHELPVVSLKSLDTVCQSTTAFKLSGGTPSGGVYSGPGIKNGLTFDPSLTLGGTHTITYAFTDTNSCSNSYKQSIRVNPTPVVTIDSVNSLCINALPVKLKGKPAGGKFSGKGVSADTLYPAIAGTGKILISYAYNDTLTRCPGTATRTITINALPKVSINDSTVCGNRKLLYDATITNPKTYLWMPGGATTATLKIDTIGRGLGQHKFKVLVTDINGCAASDSALIKFYDCTGIVELPDSKVIEVYPNPNKGEFAIRSHSIVSGRYDLLIYDILGKPVFSDTGLNIDSEFLYKLNLPRLTNGLYLMRLMSKNTGYSKRFVINK